MTRECQCHQLPLIEMRARPDGRVADLDVPLCQVTLRPQRSWLICDCDEIVGCADCECGGVLWGEGEGNAAVAEARSLLTEILAGRDIGPRHTGQHGPRRAGAARIVAMAEALAAQ